MKNKLSAIFLALLLCGSCFVSCDDDKTEATEPTTAWY